MTNLMKQTRSTTSGNVPSSLGDGQLALNLVDKRIFTANSTTIFDAFQNTVSSIAITNNSTGALIVGNSTVNSIVNSSSFSLTVNSTVNFVIGAPSAADYAAGTKVLLANGSFGTVSGGSGSPGGANTNIQYDNSGAFAGSNSFNFDNTSNTVTIQNANLTGNLVSNADYISIGNTTVNTQVNSISIMVPLGNGSNNITAPAAANSLAFFAKYKGGRVMPVTIGSSGWDTPLQGHFVHNTIYQWVPVNGSGVLTSVIRLAMANTGTGNVAVTPTTTNTFMSQTRVNAATTAVAGNTVAIRVNSTPWWRGNASGLGGFYAVTRFGVATSTTNGRAFIGFKNSASVMTNGALSAQTNLIGFGWDSGVTNVCAISANATVANTINLSGMDCTTGNTNWYEGVIFAPPNGGTVSYQLTNITTGSVVTGSYNQTNLPTTTTFLSWQFWVNNGADAAIQTVAIGGVQCEVNL